jgi:hypothetical protein
LNIAEADKRGKKKLDKWMKYRAVRMVLDTVECEMEALKHVFHMSVNEVTAPFL